MNQVSDKIVLVDMDGTCVNYSGQLERDLKKLKSPGEPDYKLNWVYKEPSRIPTSDNNRR